MKEVNGQILLDGVEVRRRWFQWNVLRKVGMAALEWLVCLFNLTFDMGVVPMGWRGRSRMTG